METSKILSADLLDILFENRNKDYGAYHIRKTYDKRIALALAGTFVLCLLFAVSSILANSKKKVLGVELVADIELKDIRQDEIKPEIPKPIINEEPKIETAKVNIPKIVPDEQVTDDDIVKPVNELENAKIGNANITGDKFDDVVMPPVEKITGNFEAPKVTKDVDERFNVVQIQAQFPGGIEGWRKYLERNLNKDLPSENGAPEGSYTVIVSFLVDKAGTISDVKAENDPGYGTKAEAIKVIQKGPHWIPAIQNGHEVIYRQKQNITFKVAIE
jgi:protein TonB